MSNEDDRYCYFLDCLTYYDGEEFIQFYGKSEGNLSYEPRGNKLKKAKSNLWYIFVPKNCDKTLAEMSDEERLSRKDDRTDATIDFINWIKEKELNSKIKKHVLATNNYENR